MVRDVMLGSSAVQPPFNVAPATPFAARRSPSVGAGASRSVLVVEDDEAVGRMLERHLTRAGYDVRIAPGLQSALAASHHIAVAIVDLTLADGDGAAVCEQLRDGAATATVPIIVLTARDDLATKLRLFAAGADDYMTKPFEPLELLARIEISLRRSGQRSEWRRLGPLEINDGGDVMLKGTALPLTAAERELMSRLAAAYPGAASHESLRHGAWRRSESSSANVIEVVVARIRKKIVSAGGGVEIRAVRGAGYVMQIATQDRERTDS